MFAVAAPKVAERWLLMAHQTQGHRKDHQRNWATLPVAVVRLGRPTPTPVDTALCRGEPDLLGLPMQRQVGEVVGQLYLFRPAPVAERDFPAFIEPAGRPAIEAFLRLAASCFSVTRLGPRFMDCFSMPLFTASCRLQ